MQNASHAYKAFKDLQGVGFLQFPFITISYGVYVEYFSTPVRLANGLSGRQG